MITQQATAQQPSVVPPFSYMTAGLRRYGEFPVARSTRPNWELQAIFKGRAHPWCADRTWDRTSTDQPRLYCFPPHWTHGWQAPAQDLSEVMVFHLRPSGLPTTVLARLPPAPVALALPELNVLRLRTLFDWLFPHFVQPNDWSMALLRGGVPLLCDLFRQPDNRSTASRPGSRSKMVEAATRLYRQSLLQRPTVEQIARGLGCSASQLRRIFAAAGQPAPDQVFRAIQMDYARRLLVGSDMPVSRIADELGFSSSSSFTRAFKQYYNHTPRQVPPKPHR